MPNLCYILDVPKSLLDRDLTQLGGQGRGAYSVLCSLTDTRYIYTLYSTLLYCSTFLSLYPTRLHCITTLSSSCHLVNLVGLFFIIIIIIALSLYTPPFFLKKMATYICMSNIGTIPYYRTLEHLFQKLST